MTEERTPPADVSDEDVTADEGVRDEYVGEGGDGTGEEEDET